jgi:opacity protein-like surface antigen
MINQKLLGCTALASLLATSNAFSQTSNFTGPSLALVASHVAAENDNTNPDISLNTTTAKNNFIAGVDFNYGFAIENNFVIGLGATYDFSKTKTGESTVPIVLDEDEVTLTFNNKLKNHYSLYIQPTYVINKDSAMFAKLAKHFAKASITESLTGAVDPSGNVIHSESKNIEGWGYGLGLKTFLSNNLFVQAEVGIINYEKYETTNFGPTSYKPEIVNATISVGYKF